MCRGRGLAMTVAGAGFASGHHLEEAAERALGQALAPLGGTPDLVCFFICGESARWTEAAGSKISAACGGAVVVGCNAGGVTGLDQGTEEHAVAVWAARLPGARLMPVVAESRRTHRGWKVDFGSGWPGHEPDHRALLLLAEEDTVGGIVSTAIIPELSQLRRGLPVVGALVRGSEGKRGNRLFCQGEVFSGGAVGVLFGGDIDLRIATSMACRPVGPPLVVTKAGGHVIHEIGGEPALARLTRLIVDLTPEERGLIAKSPFLGIALEETAEQPAPESYLIRTMIDFGCGGGAITLNDAIEVGETVRFQVRDAAAARADLDRACAGLGGKVAGALLFTDTRRGLATSPEAEEEIIQVGQALGGAARAGVFGLRTFGPGVGGCRARELTRVLLAFG